MSKCADSLDLVCSGGKNRGIFHPQSEREIFITPNELLAKLATTFLEAELIDFNVINAYQTF